MEGPYAFFGEPEQRTAYLLIGVQQIKPLGIGKIRIDAVRLQQIQAVPIVHFPFGLIG